MLPTKIKLEMKEEKVLVSFVGMALESFFLQNLDNSHKNTSSFVAVLKPGTKWKRTVGSLEAKQSHSRRRHHSVTGDFFSEEKAQFFTMKSKYVSNNILRTSRFFQKQKSSSLLN